MIQLSSVRPKEIVCMSLNASGLFLYLSPCLCVCAQLKVLPRDLQLCSETASGVDAGGQHEWGELVQLDPQTVGVIVRLERETFQVIV